MNEIKTDLTVEDDKLIVHRSNDVEPLLDHLARLRNETDGKSSSGEMYHVGDLDPVVVEDYMTQQGITLNEFFTDPVHIRRILMDPEFAKFRVWTGRF